MTISKKTEPGLNACFPQIHPALALPILQGLQSSSLQPSCERMTGPRPSSELHGRVGFGNGVSLDTEGEVVFPLGSGDTPYFGSPV